MPTQPVAEPASTQLSLQSEAGDPLGEGRAYNYTLANAEITVSVLNGLITVIAVGDEDWRGDFQIPGGGAPQVRAHENASFYPAATNQQAAMRWYSGNRGCSTATGSFWIDQVSMNSEGLVRSLVLRFERRCDGASAALRGELRWLSTDGTRPPPVIDPPPEGLWRPAAGSTPATGNFVHLVSEAGDIVGLGRTHTYTQSQALIFGSGGGSYFEIQALGDQSWYGIVASRTTAQTPVLQRGYYPEMTRYPRANPTRGGLSWVGGGRGCVDVRGWMAIDRIAYDTLGSITAIEYRFEQRCVGSTSALRGAVRWTKADADGPSTPSAGSVPGSWRPAAGSTPSSGSYVYLSGEPGDFVSGGSSFSFTPVDATIDLRESDGQLTMTVKGQTQWFADIRPAASGSPLRPGVYRDLPRNQTGGDKLPHVNISGRGNGCGTSASWVAVDDVVYAGGQLTSVHLRFEQRCSGPYDSPGIGALRGEVHWRADDLRGLPGPSADVPPNFWRPAASTTPPLGVNYLHIDSVRGEGVGLGLRSTYTQATSALDVQGSGNLLTVQVRGDQAWSLRFQGIEGRPRLEQGYYPDLQRLPWHNPARGGLDVSAGSRGCNSLRGGVIIDSIAYTPQGTLAALQMRFEQHCEGTTTRGLWGEVHWAQGDTTVPPGPVAPPADLWRPEPGSVPASGSYLHFQSLSGDFIGAGQTRTFAPANVLISLLQDQFGATATFKADPGSPFPWLAEFKVMSSLGRLQPGYYGGIAGYRFQNPARGGFSFSGDGRACNEVQAWFVVDSVTYSGNTITALKARFEQVCEGDGLLRGEINWQP